MTIGEWLVDATKQLKHAQITSNRLDAELILAHTLNRSRTFLHAHTSDELSPRRRDIADARLAMRLERIPIAYIIGHKQFYGRSFKVTPSTLIPRPESESLIELFLSHTGAVLGEKSVVDVGTGTGCLGITAKLERPEFAVTLLDESAAALAVAADNAAALHADVTCLRSDLLAHYPAPADFYLVNLPYVDEQWERSPETDHEPTGALFSDDSGMALTKQFLDQAVSQTKPGGKLFIEADPEQHDALIAHATQLGYRYLETDWYCFVLELPAN